MVARLGSTTTSCFHFVVKLLSFVENGILWWMWWVSFLKWNEFYFSALPLASFSIAWGTCHHLLALLLGWEQKCSSVWIHVYAQSQWTQWIILIFWYFTFTNWDEFFPEYLLWELTHFFICYHPFIFMHIIFFWSHDCFINSFKNMWLCRS